MAGSYSGLKPLGLRCDFTNHR